MKELRFISITSFIYIINFSTIIISPSDIVRVIVYGCAAESCVPATAEVFYGCAAVSCVPATAEVLYGCAAVSCVPANAEVL